MISLIFIGAPPDAGDCRPQGRRAARFAVKYFSGFEFFSALKQSPRAPQRHAPRRKPLSGLDSPELHKQNK